MTWFVGTLMTPATALARAHEPDRVVLVLHEASPAAGVLRTFDRMHEQLGERDLDISAIDLPRVESLEGQAQRAATIAAAEHANAVFWFVEFTNGVVRLYALHAASGRVFARDVKLRGDATARRDQLSLALRAAIPAALDGGHELGKPVLVLPPDVSARSRAKQEGEPSMRGGDAEDGEAAPVDAEKRAESWQMAVAFGYIGSSIAEDFEWQSGAAVDLMFRVPRAFRASVGAGYAAETTIRGAGADAIVSRVPIEGRLGVERALGPGNLTLEAGTILDIWRRRTRVRSDALVPAAPSTTPLWGGVLGLRVEAPLNAFVNLFLSLEAQWLPSDHAIVFGSSPEEQQEQARTLRPQIGTGLVFELGSGENDREAE
jgi:hypothetical protein